MKIYSNLPGNIFAQFALVAAQFANAHVEVEYKDKEAANAKEFKDKNPTGKFPILELDDGKIVFESQAIAGYFARLAPSSGLLGSSTF